MADARRLPFRDSSVDVVTAAHFIHHFAPDEAADAAAIYGPERYERLASIKKTYDPANMFRLNHNVPPAA